MRSCTYFVKSAEIRPDGVIHMQWAGFDRDTFLDGDFDVAPDDPEYQSWLWLRKRLKRRWFGPAGIDEQEVAKYREIFRSECT